MKSTTLVITIALAALLAACGTTMYSQGEPAFLSNYEGLATTEENSVARIAAAVKINGARIELADVVFGKQAGTALSDTERAELLTQLRHDLIQQTRALPTASDGRPVRLRAAITRIETVSPLLNTVGTLLLIGPLDRGGVAVEIEALDTETGRQVAALRMGYYVPISEISARFSKLAPAQIALQRAAAEFAGLLKPQTQAAAQAEPPRATLAQVNNAR